MLEERWVTCHPNHPLGSAHGNESFSIVVDLMLPGVVLPDGLSSLERFERDQICTVSLKGNR